MEAIPEQIVLFPEAKRVIYKKNPLDRVICQLRFPAILRIDAESPVEFQDRVRREFPNYAEKIDILVDLPLQFQNRSPHESVTEIPRTSGTKNHEFSSEDGQWKINLTRTFIALTTNTYRVWEDFKNNLKIPLNALIDVYSPAHFSRIGLRYRDVIQRSILGLYGVSWTKLLNPQILGVLADSKMGKSIQNSQSVYEIRLPDEESTVRMSTQLTQDRNRNEICYVIDSDFFNANKHVATDVIGSLNDFNKHASRLFRWCITERLHESMEPEEL